ncbi:hypothetical protein AAG906_019428 [Vitis piasezkii]
MDVKTAFLNGDLEVEIYMEQLEGRVVPGKEKKVCKLVKSLYGLKQAPKQWHNKFDHVLVTNGYSINDAYKCIYSKYEDNTCVVICLYVDDMLIFGTSLEVVCETKKFLGPKFDMKDLGEAEVILGIKITRTPNELKLSQEHYVEKILRKFERFDCKLKNKEHSVAQIEHAQIIGGLMYLMNCTRPNIAYAIDVMKSTSGYVFIFGGSIVSWKSTKQTCITRYTMEAKFIALEKTSFEAEWLENLLVDIPLWTRRTSSVSMRCDSQATIAKAKKLNLVYPLTKPLNKKLVEETLRGMGLMPITEVKSDVECLLLMNTIFLMDGSFSRTLMNIQALGLDRYLPRWACHLVGHLALIDISSRWAFCLDGHLALMSILPRWAHMCRGREMLPFLLVLALDMKCGIKDFSRRKGELHYHVAETDQLRLELDVGGCVEYTISLADLFLIHVLLLPLVFMPHDPCWQPKNFFPVTNFLVLLGSVGVGSRITIGLNRVGMTSRSGDNIQLIQHPGTPSRQNSAPSGGSFYSEICHPDPSKQVDPQVGWLLWFVPPIIMEV